MQLIQSANRIKSVCSMPEQNATIVFCSVTGSSESDVAQHCSEDSIEEEREDRLSEKAGSKSPEPATTEGSNETPSESRDTPKNLSPRSRARRELRELGTLPEHLVISKGLHLSNGTASLPLRGPAAHRHRRQASLGLISSGQGSPLKTHHKRYQSITLSGTTSKSTSAYSTMSEKSLQMETHETESLCSQRSRLTVFPSSRVEQSRVDNKSVVDELFQNHDLSRTDEEGSGLRLFVDNSKGTVTVTGEDLERCVCVCVDGCVVCTCVWCVRVCVCGWVCGVYVCVCVCGWVWVHVSNGKQGKVECTAICEHLSRLAS